MNIHLLAQLFLSAVRTLQRYPMGALLLAHLALIGVVGLALVR